MINYTEGYFGLNTLSRVYGSAAYKASLFATISSGIYLLLYYYYYPGEEDGVAGIKQRQWLDHPYPVAVVVTSFMIVLSTKVTFSYNRFWEACTALHNMHSKWMDVGTTMAAFHMQSKLYDNIQPPSFGDHLYVNDELAIQREGMEDTQDKSDTQNSNSSNGSKTGTSHFGVILNKKKKSQSGADISKSTTRSETVSIRSSLSVRPLPFPDYHTPSLYANRSRKDLGAQITQRSFMSINDDKNKPTPSLFLQEGAHLVSLLSAVALSTLRCDVEDADAPLTEFVPGRHWPTYDADDDPDLQKFGYQKNEFLTTLKYLLDISRTRRERVQYNSAHPLPVIGGISDREAALLRSARGTSAKTALVYLWLNEFIIREQLHGSLGAVAPPIVSRLQQYVSDGHLWYNAARKMSYVPFPFAHAQMAAMFEIVILFLMPGLMLSKANVWFGFCLNFLTVMLFVGLNELSKELEFPFRGMPNDLPLNLFQAQFNEGLVTMFAGYHPDAWWEVNGNV